MGHRRYSWSDNKEYPSFRRGRSRIGFAGYFGFDLRPDRILWLPDCHAEGGTEQYQIGFTSSRFHYQYHGFAFGRGLFRRLIGLLGRLPGFTSEIDPRLTFPFFYGWSDSDVAGGAFWEKIQLYHRKTYHDAAKRRKNIAQTNFRASNYEWIGSFLSWRIPFSRTFTVGRTWSVGTNPSQYPVDFSKYSQSDEIHPKRSTELLVGSSSFITGIYQSGRKIFNLVG